MFANDSRDPVLDASLLNTHYYKARIKSKWSNTEKEQRPPLHLGLAAIEKDAFGLLSFTVG